MLKCSTKPIDPIKLTACALSPHRQGHLSMVVQLMKYGADPSLIDGEGCSCVHLAAQFGHTSIVAYLIAKGQVRRSEKRIAESSERLARCVPVAEALDLKEIVGCSGCAASFCHRGERYTTSHPRLSSLCCRT